MVRERHLKIGTDASGKPGSAIKLSTTADVFEERYYNYYTPSIITWSRRALKFLTESLGDKYADSADGDH